jgi:enediyne biosynthesis thioesterase
LADGLALVTTEVSCRYLGELRAFDEVAVRMRLAGEGQTWLALAFEYVRVGPGAEETVARGEQRVACMRREGGGFVPAPVPAALRRALVPYGGSSME